MSFAAALASGCSTVPVDAVSGATAVIADPATNGGSKGAGVLIVLAVYPGSGTARIADAIAAKLGAKVLSPRQVTPDALREYELIGFGSGIFDQMHHTSLFEAVDGLPTLQGRRVFIFSTSGISRQYGIAHGIDDPHTPLREKLRAKGCSILGEFNCAGFNDNSFLKLFGGMNKGKPDAGDCSRAAEFAEGLKDAIHVAGP